MTSTTGAGLTPAQEAERRRYRRFVDAEIRGQAARFDAEERLPESLVRRLAQEGYLGAPLPAAWGGPGLDAVTLGLLYQEVGRGCSSVRSLLTVHHMVAKAILKWGSQAQRQRWLPRLARGEAIAAFALSEPGVGSDAAQVETAATREGDGHRLEGVKKWISFGQIADVFLVLARCDEKPTAFLVERGAPGLSVRPLGGLLGLRASMLAELRLEGAPAAADGLLGRIGFGFSHVAATALELGRYGVAWGCVGLVQACLEECLRYAGERRQFGALLQEHALVRRMITDMITGLKAARLLCLEAGRLLEAGEAEASSEVLVAKYFASRAAAEASRDAVQIHGAHGCADQHAVSRYFRDAKVLEIVEGTHEILQLAIAAAGGRVSPDAP